MAKKKVCVSFDFDHDNYYYYLLEAWNRNPSFEFSIDDCTPREIQSEKISVIKQVLSRKISTANYMISIVGRYSTQRHPDSDEIGYHNWQAYEIAKNQELGNGLVVVKLDRGFYAPDEAYGKGTQWVYSFNEADIIEALSNL